ncbi:MAG: hypothetical protein ACYC5F_04500 [Thermoleophilia bacterium]
MDIQKMVDERLEELRTQTIRISRPFGNDEEPDLREFSENRTPPDPLAQSREELSKLGDLMDSSLAEVAERVLDITDRVAGDYARMEKDILDSRLALLQSAEAVLDIAITLRRKARSMISASSEGQVGLRSHVRPEYDEDYRYRYSLHEGLNEGRVSMHDQGVASLFRRT